jgi:hypothetical protein
MLKAEDEQNCPRFARCKDYQTLASLEINTKRCLESYPAAPRSETSEEPPIGIHQAPQTGCIVSRLSFSASVISFGREITYLHVMYWENLLEATMTASVPNVTALRCPRVMHLASCIPTSCETWDILEVIAWSIFLPAPSCSTPPVGDQVCESQGSQGNTPCG